MVLCQPHHPLIRPHSFIQTPLGRILDCPYTVQAQNSSLPNPIFPLIRPHRVSKIYQLVQHIAKIKFTANIKVRPPSPTRGEGNNATALRKVVGIFVAFLALLLFWCAAI